MNSSKSDFVQLRHLSPVHTGGDQFYRGRHLGDTHDKLSSTSREDFVNRHLSC